MEWYEIQNAYEISHKIFSAESINNSPEISYFLLETLDNISDFFCQILLKAKPKLDISKSSIQKHIEDFNKNHNTKLSYRDFIESNWLREIFDEIYIPSAVLRFAEQESELNECKYKISLLFIKQMHDVFGNEDEMEMQISKADFGSIYNHFQNFDSSFPNIDDLLIKYDMREEANGYYFKLWNLNRKLSSFVPVKLLTILYKNKNQDEQALKKWIRLIRYISVHDILNIIPDEYAVIFIKTLLQILKTEKDLQFTNEKTEIRKILFDSYSFFRKTNDLFKIATIDISIDFSNPIKYWYKLCYSGKFMQMGLFNSDSRAIYTQLLFAIVSDNDPHRFKKTYSKLLSLNNISPFVFLETLFLMRHHVPEKFILLMDPTPFGVVFLCEYLNCCFSETMRYNKFSSSLNTQSEIVFQSFLKHFFQQPDSDTKLLAFILLYLLKMKELYKNDTRKEIIETLVADLKYQCRESVQKGYQINFVEGFTEYNELFINSCASSLNIFPFEFYFTLLDFWKDDKTKSSIYTSQLYEKYISTLSETSQISVLDAYQSIMKFEWIRLTGFLFENDKNKFYSFCSFGEQFFNYCNPRDSKDYDFNSSNATKARIHLIAIVSSFLPSRYVDKELHAHLENVLYNFLRKSFSNNTKFHKLFLFSDLYESRIAFNHEIFPYIAQGISRLNNQHKKSLLKVILKESPYNIWFELYELLGEKDKKYLEDELSKLDFTKITDESYTIPKLYLNTVRVINSHIANGLGNRLFDKLDTVVQEKARKGIVADFTIDCEFLKLFLLYKNNKRKELEKYNFPYTTNNYDLNNGIKALERQKRYYLVLLDIAENKIISAHNKLSGLLKEEPNNTEYKAMFLYVLCFKKTEEKDSNFNDLLEQIEKMLKNTGSSEYIYERLQYAKLVILDKTDSKDKLHYFYALPEILRTNVYYVTRVIKDQKEEDKKNMDKSSGKAFDLFYNISEEWKETSEYKNLQNNSSQKNKMLLKVMYMFLLIFKNYKNLILK